jgi:hypothetical protein
MRYAARTDHSHAAVRDTLPDRGGDLVFRLLGELTADRPSVLETRSLQ